MPSTSVRHLSAAFGVELCDLDLRDLARSAQAVDRLRAALRDDRLVVLRGQRVDTAALVAAAATLGPLHGERAPSAPPGTPEVRTELEAEAGGDAGWRVYFNEQWHADLIWADVEPAVTVLAAVTVEAGCATTEFADMCGALDALGDATARELATLSARHHVELSREARHGAFRPPHVPVRRGVVDRIRSKGRQPRWPSAPAGTAIRPVAVPERPGRLAPVVDVDPRSGRRFVNLGDHAWTIEGMPEPAGVERVVELDALAVAHAPVVVHEWRNGDVVMFDNRTLRHRRGQRREGGGGRVLRRVIVWPGEVV